MLLIAGGAFASVYVVVSTSSGDFLVKSSLALLFALVLAGFALVLRLLTPPEKVALQDEVMDELLDKVEQAVDGSSEPANP